MKNDKLKMKKTQTSKGHYDSDDYYEVLGV